MKGKTTTRRNYGEPAIPGHTRYPKYAGAHRQSRRRSYAGRRVAAKGTAATGQADQGAGTGV